MSMLNPKRTIFVTFQREGIHAYPGADKNPKLATGDWDDVSFLAVPHRHIFHARVEIEVFHDERDIEFIQFKRWLERHYDQGTLNFSGKSCETIANELGDAVMAKYPHRELSITIAEDGENGATIVWSNE